MPMNPRLLRPTASGFNPRQISGLALWLDAADSQALYTTDAGPGVAAVASPLDISGCVGWYDSLDLTAMAQNSDGTGAVSVGDQVGWWKDKSATAAHVTQGTAENRPTLTANQVNGLAALKFDGSNDNLSSANYTAQNSLSGLTRILILQNATFAGGYVTRVWNGGGDGLVVINAAIRQYVSADTNYTLHATPSGSNALSLGIYSFRYGSSAMSLRSNGSGLSGTVNGTIPATTGAGTPALHIGSNIGANQFYNGVVAEYIIYNRELSAAELSRVEVYLAAKWGISNVHAPATSASQPVGYWGDKSGNGRHATRSIAARRPTVSATTQNGRRTIDFTAASNTGMTAPGAQALKDGGTLCGVYFSGSVNFSMLLNVGNNASGQRWDIGSSLSRVNLGLFGGGLNPQASASNRALLLTGLFDKAANTVTLRLNGTAVASGTASPALVSYASDLFGIGMNNGDSEQWLNGRVFELAAYGRPLAATEARRLEEYLARRWGITLAPQVSNADAQDWVNRVYAAGSTVSQPVANAVSAFVDGCQSDGIWDAMKSVVLLAGADTLAGALVPLKGAAPTNNNFVSGDYDRETGLVGNGTNKSLDSNRNNNADPQDNKSFSVYVSNAGADGGVVRAVIYSGFNNTAGSSGFGYRNSDGASNFNNNNTIAEAPTIANPVGLVGASRSSSANYVARFGGSDTTYTRTSETPNNANYTLYQTGGARFSGVRLAFYHIGESLDLEALDTRVSALITAIGAAI